MKNPAHGQYPIFSLLLFFFYSIVSVNAQVLVHNDDNQTYTESKTVERSNATFVNVQISFLGGRMNVAGGSNELMNAKFGYSEMKWKPGVEYEVKNKIGNLKVSMPDAGDDIHMNDDNINEWNIRLNNDILLDLSIRLGGGEGDYDLSQLKMNSLEIKLGGGKLNIDLRNASLPKLDFKGIAGEATVDLSGNWKNDLEADFVCGIGELNLKLPEKIGVKVIASGILGEIHASDFFKEGSTYTNSAYKKTKITLNIDIFGGIGNVNLELVD